MIITRVAEETEERDLIERTLGTASLVAFGTELGAKGAMRVGPSLLGLKSKAYKKALRTVKYSKLLKWGRVARGKIPMKMAMSAAGKGAIGFSIGVRAVAGIANPLMWGLLGAEVGYGIAKGTVQVLSAIGRRELLGTIPRYEDTQRAYTERQRAIQAIHNSGQTARSVIGREASFMHM